MSAAKTVSAEEILYGRVPVTEPSEQEQEQKRDQAIQEFLPTWWPTELNHPVAAPEFTALGVLGLHKGYYQDLNGFSGGRDWMVKSESLPAAWIKTHAAGISHYRQARTRAASLRWQEELTDIDLEKYADEDASLHYLAQLSPRAVEFSGRERTLELNIAQTVQMAIIEILCPHQGEWKLLDQPFNAVYVGVSDILGACRLST